MLGKICGKIVGIIWIATGILVALVLVGVVLYGAWYVLVHVLIQGLIDLFGYVFGIAKSLVEYLDISGPGIIKFVLVSIVFVFFVAFAGESLYLRLSYFDSKKHDELKSKTDRLANEVNRLSKEIHDLRYSRRD